MACQNTVLMVLPTWDTAANATTAIKEASSAYSSRSWPKSDNARRRSLAFNAFMSIGRFLLKSNVECRGGHHCQRRGCLYAPAAWIAPLLNAFWYETDDARPICRAPSVESNQGSAATTRSPPA